MFELGASDAAAISQAQFSNNGNKRGTFQVMGVVMDLNGGQMASDTEFIGQKIVFRLSQSWTMRALWIGCVER